MISPTALRYRGVSVRDYAATLVAEVREDIARNPARFRRARSWSDLHDVVDANDYLLLTNDVHGIEMPDDDAPGALDRYLDFVNEAISLADAELFGRRRTSRRR